MLGNRSLANAQADLPATAKCASRGLDYTDEASIPTGCSPTGSTRAVFSTRPASPSAAPFGLRWQARELLEISHE